MRINMKRALTLEAAMELVAAATAEATRIGCPCVVAVVDDGGWLLALQRMDGAPMLSSVELAPGKARTAALFRKPTELLEFAINGGRYAQTTARQFIQMKGGLPILVEGEVVGAIGVSADTPAHDQEIAISALRSVGC
jgi:glc operon protein GlcG